jgi:hypothetical protein
MSRGNINVFRARRGRRNGGPAEKRRMKMEKQVQARFEELLGGPWPKAATPAKLFEITRQLADDHAAAHFRRSFSIDGAPVDYAVYHIAHEILLCTAYAPFDEVLREI